jgi:ABC-type nitrate/sulfonate/bicarbonate transport system substrate-binding protein
MRTWRTIAASVGIVAALTLTACGDGGSGASGGSGDAGELPKVRIGVAAVNASHLWTIVARNHNIMQEHGVDMELVTFQAGASQVVPAILSGSVELGIQNGQQTLLAQLQEPEVTGIGVPMIGSPLFVVARKGINSLEELRGATISVNAVNGSEDFFSGSKFLASKGLTTKDVKYITGGATNARIASLLAGSVDAVFCSPPDVARIEAAGGKVLGQVNDVPEIGASLAYMIIGKSSYLEANRNTMVKFMAGYQATQKFMIDPANKDAVVADIVKDLKTDQANAEETYHFWVETVAKRLDPTGAIADKNLVQTLENAQATGAKALLGYDRTRLKDVYDNSFAEAAAKG